MMRQIYEEFIKTLEEYADLVAYDENEKELLIKFVITPQIKNYQETIRRIKTDKNNEPQNEMTLEEVIRYWTIEKM